MDYSEKLRKWPGFVSKKANLAFFRVDRYVCTITIVKIRVEGKGPGSILKLARTHHKPGFLFAGHIEAALLPLLKDDFPHVEATSITPSTYPMAKALKETASLLTKCLRKRFSLTY